MILLQFIGSILAWWGFTVGFSVFIAWMPRISSFRKMGAAALQNIAVSLGILGTFLGIFGGILNLDPQGINDGVPVLLGGLRTAFLTSITGMIVALIIKLRPGVYGLAEEQEAADPETTELTLIRKELEGIARGLTGEEETSLVTQLQKIRTTLGDKQDALKQAFDEFAKQMAENNVKALVEAVNKVMEDFNAKINDRLGESFKELADSVKNLVEWQRDYKSLIESSTESLGVIQESLKNSSESLSNTSDKVAQIAENNKKIEELNQEFKLAIEKLNQMLESTVDFSRGMKTLSQELSGSGENIRKEVKEIMESSMKDMRIHTEEVIRSINSMTEVSLRNMREKNNDALKSFEEINMKTLQEFGRGLASISAKLAEDFSKVEEGLSARTN